MALFTDGQINGTQDLQDYESSILEVANIENIDLSAKMALGQDEIGKQLLLFLLRKPFRDFKSAIRRTIGASDVVITAPLKQWHALKSLALAYRDAYNNQLNDRYLGKWNEYQQLARDAAADFFQIGVGLLADPVRRADNPVLSTSAGTAAGGTYSIAASWLNNGRQEGAISGVSSITTADGLQVYVSAPAAPSNVTSWNVYAGIVPDVLTLQNAAPMAIGSTWVLPAGGLRPGTAPTQGQPPERFLVQDRLLQRG